MSDTTKMLQTIIDGQRAIKEELSGKIDKVRNEVSVVKEEVNGVRKELKSVEKNLTERIDKIGLQIARLEDDAPTVEEMKELEERVETLEKTSITA